MARTCRRAGTMVPAYCPIWTLSRNFASSPIILTLNMATIAAARLTSPPSPAPTPFTAALLSFCAIRLKLKSAAVKGVGAGLGGDVNLAAAIVAIFSVKIIGDDAKFRDRVQIGQYAGTIVPALLHVRAIHHESVGAFALSIDGLIAGVLIARGRAIICVWSLRPVRSRNDAGLKRKEIGIRAAV